MSGVEWRASVTPLVRSLMDSGEFPYVERIVAEAEDLPESDAVFERRLGYVFDGLAASVRAARLPTARRHG
jgi:hypothetical protein